MACLFGLLTFVQIEESLRRHEKKTFAVSRSQRCDPGRCIMKERMYTRRHPAPRIRERRLSLDDALITSIKKILVIACFEETQELQVPHFERYEICMF